MSLRILCKAMQRSTCSTTQGTDRRKYQFPVSLLCWLTKLAELKGSHIRRHIIFSHPSNQNGFNPLPFVFCNRKNLISPNPCPTSGHNVRHFTLKTHAVNFASNKRTSKVTTVSGGTCHPFLGPTGEFPQNQPAFDQTGG